MIFKINRKHVFSERGPIEDDNKSVTCVRWLFKYLPYKPKIIKTLIICIFSVSIFSFQYINIDNIKSFNIALNTPCKKPIFYVKFL